MSGVESVLIKAILSSVSSKGTSLLFSEAIERLQEEKDLSEDEIQYIDRAVQVIIDIELTYKYNIENRDDPDVETFLQDLDSAAKEATELEVISEMKGFDPKKGGSSVLIGVASGMAAISDNYAGVSDRDDIPQDTTPDELYQSSAAARNSMPIFADTE
ncbi:hypothetical protein Har1130_19025 [Haloarcula sp. CBA1130]|uniref:hypothetical protein n=1 Tax=unclassified Haloarcula TaxID=2624677 RepID=UPI0012480940|nr:MULTISPECIES: hypothetical protein [unclassified Haloarcula]KAA9396242.1 hypothetical protein Har1129_17840 [Haloarcula sp. CBA1129]KAA9396374.1 hypothetical protein Har1130_19025 [Haloarcula sp. CBA1130]KAA9397454.1 hypothetical protein Har1129_03990 [Haloarcula sp. CBA1129]